MNFAAAADELRCQEFARLAASVTPMPGQLRSMSVAELQIENALMFERIGHTVHTAPDAPELVTTRGGRKFITMCANPADPAPTGSAALRRLRDRVVVAGAEHGFFVSMRGFTAEARHFAETAPVRLIDAEQFIDALNRSRKGELLPQTYKAMCRQCGAIVQHSLDNGQARSCANGHSVAPTIARDELVKPQLAQPLTAAPSPAPAHTPRMARVRNMSAKAQRRRAIKAHNYSARAQAIRQQRRSSH
jgi:Restriction endonuclease